MTRIGQMIFDDGVVRGLEEGRKEGQAEEKKTYVPAYSKASERKTYGRSAEINRR